MAADPVGPLPALGLTSPARPEPPSGRAARRLRALRLSHLRAELDLTGAGWRTRLGYAAAEAARLGGAPLEVAVAATTGGQLDTLAAHLAASRMPLARLLVFAPGSWVTTGALARAAGDTLARHRLPVPLGGGSYAWFTQLNRAFEEAAGDREPLLSRLSQLGFALSPQVHAGDETTLRESLTTLAPIVGQARDIAAGRPLAIGPVTLRPRFPPTATGPPVPELPGALPANVDPRQPSLLTAGWLVGALVQLARPGVGSITLSETLGARGVLQPDAPDAALARFPAPPGAVFPVWHVLAALGRVRGGTVWHVHNDQPAAVTGLAAASTTQLVVLVANLTGVSRRLRLRLPPGDYRWRRLDDRTAAASLAAGRAGLPVEPLRLPSGTATLATPPYALQLLTGVVPPPASRR